MSKASNELLEQLHGLIAQNMLDRLKSDGGCEAKEWAVIIKFLADNNIDAAPSDHTSETEDAFSALMKAAQTSIAQTGAAH